MQIWFYAYLATVFLVLPYFVFFPLVKKIQNKIQIHKPEGKPSKLLYLVSGSFVSLMFGITVSILLVRIRMGYDL